MFCTVTRCGPGNKPPLRLFAIADLRVQEDESACMAEAECLPLLPRFGFHGFVAGGCGFNFQLLARSARAVRHAAAQGPYRYRI